MAFSYGSTLPRMIIHSPHLGVYSLSTSEISVRTQSPTRAAILILRQGDTHCESLNRRSRIHDGIRADSGTESICEGRSGCTWDQVRHHRRPQITEEEQEGRQRARDITIQAGHVHSQYSSR